MSQTTIDKLVKWVMIRLDELRPNAERPEPAEGIDRELDEAALWMLKNLPRELLLDVTKKARVFDTSQPIEPQALHFYTHVVPDGNGKRVFVALPLDFLQFLRLKLDGWNREVDVLYPLNSTYHVRQNNEYTRATINAPIGFMVPWVYPYGHHDHPMWSGPALNFTRAIECYPYVDAGNELSALYYIGKRKAVEMPEVYHDAMVWIATSRVLQAMREPNLASAAMQFANTSISTIRQGIFGEHLMGRSDG